METKKEFKYFTIFNHESEEKYLREMHKNGWRFVRVSGFGVYRFEKCEPADVVYQLDYNSQSKKNREEYLRMFEDCGWTYIQEYVGYSYFCKPADLMKDDESIFNDSESRADMMGRVFAGRILPLLSIFLCLVVPQFVLNILNGDGVFALIYGVILSVYVALFAACIAKYGISKRK